MTMAVTLEQLRARSDDIRRLLEARGADNPRVFGSVAKGAADERSDVDILIDFREPRPEGFAYFGTLDELQRDLGLLLETAVHVTQVDPASPAGRRILSEAVPL